MKTLEKLQSVYVRTLEDVCSDLDNGQIELSDPTTAVLLKECINVLLEINDLNWTIVHENLCFNDSDFETLEELDDILNSMDISSDRDWETLF